jgi:hypothetical protein
MIARGVLGAGGATRTDRGVKRTGGAREGSARRAGTRTRAGGDDPDYNDWMERLVRRRTSGRLNFGKNAAHSPGRTRRLEGTRALGGMKTARARRRFVDTKWTKREIILSRNLA